MRYINLLPYLLHTKTRFYFYCMKLDVCDGKFSYVVGGTVDLYRHVPEADLLPAGEPVVSRILHAGRREVQEPLTAEAKVAVIFTH